MENLPLHSALLMAGSNLSPARVQGRTVFKRVLVEHASLPVPDGGTAAWSDSLECLAEKMANYLLSKLEACSTKNCPPPSN